MSRTSISKGDILEIRREGYCHYAIAAEYVPRRSKHVKVIHVSHSASACNAECTYAEVRMETLEISAAKTNVRNSLDENTAAFPPDEVVCNAIAKIGPWDYSHVHNNCEHFVKMCRYGLHVSEQFPHLTDMHGVLHSTSLVGQRNIGDATITMAEGKLGLSEGNLKGVVVEANIARLEAGPVKVNVGFGATTGVQASDSTLGIEVLGTGIKVGRECKVSFLGNSVGLKLW